MAPKEERKVGNAFMHLNGILTESLFILNCSYLVWDNQKNKSIGGSRRAKAIKMLA